MTQYKAYAGIGSRKTPNHVIEDMASIAVLLMRGGYTLRSGGADGADLAFERGVIREFYSTGILTCPMEIFSPWDEHREDRIYVPVDLRYPEKYPVIAIAARHHPVWDRLTSPVRKLHIRNVYQILGADLQRKSEFVLCWTQHPDGSGGTGQAIRIANEYNVPVFNMRRPEIDAAIKLLIKEDKPISDLSIIREAIDKIGDKHPLFF